MNKEQEEFFRSLDEEGLDGTVQSLLLNDNLEAVPFEKAAKFLITRLFEEKQALVQDNIKLSNLVEELGGEL